ncbi:sigma-54-dependent Fis family transcriptional regulator [Niveibacterium umoris]|uniref:Transcriptional regulator with PAS, ATPase and Fis domain n=1 Tax=Niveibacterium umoris TaxID=1193620 RepID=A0A840BPT2_9RHOO|nr:sigma 54-interacting transcriptional regulator [Niveibacterium umoris]MBB4013538.1 transcriptional regulator with PAS, ATPase and Fis domain [Niveibacterium umoris]
MPGVEAVKFEGWFSGFGEIRQQAMRTLFDALNELCEGTLIIDADCRIVWINARYSARFGVHDPRDAIGRVIEEVIPTSSMREVVRTGQPILLDVLETGTDSFVVIRLPLKDETGKLIGAIGFALFDRLQPLAPLFSKYVALQDELRAARASLAAARRSKYTLSNFVGASPRALQVKHVARRAAAVDAPVLLLGETGTGKEILAHAIHAASARAHRPFVSLNVAAIPEALLEAEFFGVAPGAYTGADKRAREGKFQLAEGGTLFLDEIGEMPLALQTKLLRVLQDQEFEPLGSNRVVKADVRIIGATCAELESLVAAGRFRPDLYYRLNVITLKVPSLAERIEDLPLLTEALLEEIALRSGTTPREFDASALQQLAQRPWPGNVRELRNVLERAVAMCEATRLSAEHIAPILGAPVVRALPAAATVSAARSMTPDEIPRYEDAMRDAEHALLSSALAACKGSATEAARRLGIGRATLYRRMHAVGLMTQS